MSDIARDLCMDIFERNDRILELIEDKEALKRLIRILIDVGNRNDSLIGWEGEIGSREEWYKAVHYAERKLKAV